MPGVNKTNLPTSGVDNQTYQPAFILEGKVPAEFTREDGGGGEATSFSPSPQVESPGPWQSESLLVESWSTMGDMDPEDTKSIDSSDGMALAGEENHSSNSDMVHLEREEAEMLEEAAQAAAEGGEEETWRRTEEEEEEDEELQTSVLSVLGEERELVELREEEQDFQARETEELLVSAEEPNREKLAEFMQVVPLMALPPLPIVKLDPPSTTSTPVPLTTTSEGEEFRSMQGLHPPPVLAPIEHEPSLASKNLDQLKFSQIPLAGEEETSVKTSEAASEKPEPEPHGPKTAKPQSSTELPVMLCGGAALVAIIGVVAYGAVAYFKK
ncbi:hypothetical protein LDENG_00015890 [Lucifuga dentata]|nr:hypothetical protein LDENG_00015890 [Lucifuga dentata]